MSTAIEARRAALRARFGVWEPVTLSGFLARSAEEYGGRPFVITDERTATLGAAKRLVWSGPGSAPASRPSYPRRPVR